LIVRIGSGRLHENDDCAHAAVRRRAAASGRRIFFEVLAAKWSPDVVVTCIGSQASVAGAIEGEIGRNKRSRFSAFDRHGTSNCIVTGTESYRFRRTLETVTFIKAFAKTGEVLDAGLLIGLMTIDESKLRFLLDRAAIIDVQLRYALGVDMRDWALFRSCFTDEIEIDSSSAARPPQRWKADEWVELVRRTIDGMKTTQHIITNQIITIDHDEATCIAYVQARHHLPNESGENDQNTYGYYTNHLVRMPSGWKIRARKLTITSNEGNMDLFELARRRLAEAEGRGSPETKG
jgi:SnoaL-like domain